MLIVLSPAKTLDYETPLPRVRATQPRFLEHSQELVDRLRTLSPARIGAMMKVSEKIAALNAARFAEWQVPFDADVARPAVFAFMGDVYTGLRVREFDEATLKRAQRQLRILSGLYGVLRPLDLMRPYRLEMGTPLANGRGENLYQFWGSRISESLNADLPAQGDDILVNLASNEYFRAVDRQALRARVITPVFQDEKQGVFKVISFHAKKARGLMAAWMLREGVSSPEALTGFDVDGYRFAPAESQGDTLVFRRREKDLPRKA